MTHSIQDFFGDDWDETFDSIKSAPGALGNIVISGLRQLRLIDCLALVLVFAGWLWLATGYLGGVTDHTSVTVAVSLLPTALWLFAGFMGGFIFYISGLGVRSLGYWEAYVLMLVFGLFGVTTLRVALSPRGGQIYRGATKPPTP